MEKINNLKEWINSAISELSSALYLAAMKPCPANIICFHCQRCVEKLLKGFLTFNGENVQQANSLMILNTICIDYNPEFKSIRESCEFLNGYNIEICYPRFIELTKDDALKAIFHTESILSFIINKWKSDDFDDEILKILHQYKNSNA
ncbi:HEPN domain-containing protein [Bacillus mycoides]|uniref:HEPN domain-containing protein n=1 Tax=Bacillus mycoides TaxID=1405 RepID=UPI000278CA5F|nr:HEPN domain-containing protein [Bacillus mycoides]EJQ61849.1 hypothetical protein IEW_01951 [Bacillus mycoides]EJQ63198.1 hypothetical protein IEY_03381 [Bacillus mycoides]EJV68965.1 hypothetical protein IEU_01954 [Bacillus mycoides]MDR4304786.1 HEPN domain-containing protein [Bacillus mycoides]